MPTWKAGILKTRFFTYFKNTQRPVTRMRAQVPPDLLYDPAGHGMQVVAPVAESQIEQDQEQRLPADSRSKHILIWYYPWFCFNFLKYFSAN